MASWPTEWRVESANSTSARPAHRRAAPEVDSRTSPISTTSMLAPSWTTWLFVSIRPPGLMMKPDTLPPASPAGVRLGQFDSQDRRTHDLAPRPASKRQRLARRCYMRFCAEGTGLATPRWRLCLAWTKSNRVNLDENLVA